MLTKKYYPYLIISPFFILFVIFRVLPFFVTLYRSFIDMDGTRTVFVWINNYLSVLSDRLFYKSLFNSISIYLMLITIKIPLLLFVSSLLYNSNRRRLFLWFIYLPVLIGSFAYAIIYRYLFTYNGMINDIFKSLFDFQIDFLGEPFFAKGTIVFALLWGSLGINIVLVINGLSKLPIEYIEYGKIEGVNRFQAIRYIYMPYIKTLLITILFLSLIESISTIEIPLMLTLGGPTQSTFTLGYYMYQQAFSYNSFSNAASAGIILILIGLMVILLFQRRLNHEKTN